MIDPAIAHRYNKATELLNKKKHEKAASEFKAILKIYEFKEAYLNLGNCYKFLDKDVQCLQAYHKANDPKVPFLDGKLVNAYPLALNNLGLAAFTYGRDDDAIESYDKAIAENEKFYDAWWNKATATLRKACTGDTQLFYEGWNLYEHRFTKTPPVSLNNDMINLMQWQGQRDVRVIILAEQGIGDNIMFYRFVDLLVEQYNITPVIQSDPKTQSLFPSKYEIGMYPSQHNVQYGIPMCSLGRFVNMIPNEPYLHHDEFLPLEGINIGVVWSGSSTHANDRHRSVNVQRFKRFEKYGQLWNLNPGVKSPVKWVKDCNVKDWKDTQSWVNSLDCVVSVDTSIIHLVGAMGRPGIMIQPFKETDFRWGTDSLGQHNLWYPSVKIARNPQNWEMAFETAEEYLEELV